MAPVSICSPTAKVNLIILLGLILSACSPQPEAADGTGTHAKTKSLQAVEAAKKDVSGPVFTVTVDSGESFRFGPSQAQAYALAVDWDRNPHRHITETIQAYEAVVALDRTSAIADKAYPRLDELRARFEAAEQRARERRAQLLNSMQSHDTY